MTLPASCAWTVPPPRMARSAPITTAKESALTKKAVAAPNAASSTPATAGPMARATVAWSEFRRTASSILSAGTSSTMNACHGAWFTPFPTATTSTQARMTPGLADPLNQTSHNASAPTSITDCDESRTVRLENRSARDPESGPNTTTGKNVAKAPTPTHVLEWVSWSSTNGTVTSCMRVPMLDTAAADQNSPKSRCRRAANEPPTTRPDLPSSPCMSASAPSRSRCLARSGAPYRAFRE